MEAISLDHLRKQVPDEELRKKLVPDFTFGCKRVLVSDDYYPALTQPNVQLIASGLATVRCQATPAPTTDDSLAYLLTSSRTCYTPWREWLTYCPH